MAQKKPRRVVAPTFGALLTQVRGARKGVEVCRRLRAYGLTCDPSQLHNYEHGYIATPDPAILWALVQIYELDSADGLLSALAQDRGHRARTRSVVVPPVARLTADQLRCAEEFGLLTLDQQRHLMEEMRLYRTQMRAPYARRKVRRHGGRLPSQRIA